mmetsp:Transcript_899/g.1423  ORF Transcript_899/g.1423 Transcript_899/m.1423 type:complete len:323 (+) Transcript_899:149-1117(+)
MSSPVPMISADALDESNNNNSNDENGKKKQQSMQQGDKADDNALPPPMLPMVDVIAPSNLEGGYTFDAVHDGQVFSVTVPPGGVKAGEAFSVPFAPYDVVVAEAVLMSDESYNDYNNNPTMNNEVTPLLPPASSSAAAVIGTTTNNTGVWKDGLCDCCSEGCCHPSLCNSMFFRQILMGQVLTRMRMTWCGNRASRDEYKKTFSTLLVLTISYWIFWWFFHCHDHGRNCYGPRQYIMNVVNFVWVVYTMVVMIKLRKAVRDRYKIPQKHCRGCEDCCCVFFCSCCTMAQLARQTADYNQQRAYCCTETGLSEHQMLQEALIV